MRDLDDGLKHAIRVAKHLMVPEPQNLIALLHQERLTTRVLPLLGCVLSPVQLDDEAVFEAHEIDDESPKRTLAAELEPRKLALAQAVPQHALRIGGAPSSGSGRDPWPPSRQRITGVQCFGTPLTPALSPRGEGEPNEDIGMNFPLPLAGEGGARDSGRVRVLAPPYKINLLKSVSLARSATWVWTY